MEREDSSGGRQTRRTPEAIEGTAGLLRPHREPRRTPWKGKNCESMLLGVWGVGGVGFGFGFWGWLLGRTPPRSQRISAWICGTLRVYAGICWEMLGNAGICWLSLVPLAFAGPNGSSGPSTVLRRPAVLRRSLGSAGLSTSVDAFHLLSRPYERWIIRGLESL